MRILSKLKNYRNHLQRLYMIRINIHNFKKNLRSAFNHFDIDKDLSEVNMRSKLYCELESRRSYNHHVLDLEKYTFKDILPNPDSNIDKRRHDKAIKRFIEIISEGKDAIDNRRINGYIGYGDANNNSSQIVRHTYILICVNGDSFLIDDDRLMIYIIK